jgi:hypothetical protein
LGYFQAQVKRVSLTHLYISTVLPNSTVEILIDTKVVRKANMLMDFDSPVDEGRHIHNFVVSHSRMFISGKMKR